MDSHTTVEGGESEVGVELEVEEDGFRAAAQEPRGGAVGRVTRGVLREAVQFGVIEGECWRSVGLLSEVVASRPRARSGWREVRSGRGSSEPFFFI